MEEKKRTGNNHRHDSCGCPHQISTVMKWVYVGYVGLKEPGKGERNCLGFLQPCRFGDGLLATCSEN
jgi:hypothetical protein